MSGAVHTARAVRLWEQYTFSTRQIVEEAWVMRAILPASRDTFSVSWQVPSMMFERNFIVGPQDPEIRSMIESACKCSRGAQISCRGLLGTPNFFISHDATVLDAHNCHAN